MGPYEILGGDRNYLGFTDVNRVATIRVTPPKHGASNPITAERKYELEQMMGDCADKCIYVTAFESNDAFRNCKEDLAWETEIWIVTNPDHMIHRNEFRFMGPYGKTVE